MQTTPPPPPDASAFTPPHEDTSKQRNAWIALSIIVLTPVLWAVGLFIAFVVLAAPRAWRFLPEDNFFVVTPLPFVVAGVIAITRHGLRRGWHLRPWILWVGSFAAAGVVMLAVLAVQAVVSVLHRSEDMAVLGTVRQLAAAADQYYLENDVTSVALSQLVGPTNYVKALRIVNQESYPTHFTQGATITASGIAGARTITYTP